MDALDFHDTGWRDDQPDRPPLPTRRLHVRNGAARLPVTSDLCGDEAVTEAEIKLIMAVLGDTIARILNTDSSE
jgi:hypothetical protein